MNSFEFGAVPSSMEFQTSARLTGVKDIPVPRTGIELSAPPNELELTAPHRKSGRACSGGLTSAHNRSLQDATREIVTFVHDDVV